MSGKILKLDELLKLDEKITSTEVTPLTAPGENYGSLMLSVEVTTESNSKMNLVAKTLPPSPEMQEMFNCPVTFPNEIAFYKTIVPTLVNFQRKHGVNKVVVNFAARYFGSRTNLHGKSEEIDEDAVLLLENLKLKGFVNLERTEGFDLEGAKSVLSDLAHLHGVAIALKLQEPEVFQEKVRPYLTGLSVSKEVYDDWEEQFSKAIHCVPDLEPYLDRLKQVSVEIYPGPKCREPFGTISHNDCWVNNIMVRLEEGETVENKLVDFQMCDYASPAKDVLFFIFSSVQNHILREYCDSLIRYYHEVFIAVLSELECDLAPFSFDEFQKELDFEARHTQLAHTVLMLLPIFAPRGSVTDLKDFKPSDLGNDEPTDLHEEKLVLIVEEFAKRNWI